MALVGTIIVGLALAIGALNGARRGALKEGMALIGVLLGALLVTFWAERWGVTLSRATNWRPELGQWAATLAVLWGTALFSGYGSAALLPRRPGGMPWTLRAGGALLGLVNGGLLTGFTLLYTQRHFYGANAAARGTSWVEMAVASRFMIERLDLIVLGVAWTFAVVSLVVTLIRLVRSLIAPQPASAPAPSARASSSQPLPPDSTARPPSAQGTSPAADASRSRDATATQSTTRPPGMEPSFLDNPRTPTGGKSS